MANIEEDVDFSQIDEQIRKKKEQLAAQTAQTAQTAQSALPIQSTPASTTITATTLLPQKFQTSRSAIKWDDIQKRDLEILATGNMEDFDRIETQKARPPPPARPRSPDESSIHWQTSIDDEDNWAGGFYDSSLTNITNINDRIVRPSEDHEIDDLDRALAYRETRRSGDGSTIKRSMASDSIIELRQEIMGSLEDLNTVLSEISEETTGLNTTLSDHEEKIDQLQQSLGTIYKVLKEMQKNQKLIMEHLAFTTHYQTSAPIPSAPISSTDTQP